MRKTRFRCSRINQRETGARPRLAALARAAVLALPAMSAPASAQDGGPTEEPPKDGAPLAAEKANADFELSVEVGGAPMAPSRNILENAALSKEHTRFVADAEAAGLAQTLTGGGPFTLFAPVNQAFQHLPKSLSDRLVRPENASILNQILSYHVLPGKYSAADFIAAIKAGGGKATFKTLEGDELSLRQDGRRLEILDSQGGRAIVTISDVNQKNGVIHVIDAVLLPKG
jgi:uncharacterized surface protein with fasciclin (FAS1) repeats